MAGFARATGMRSGRLLANDAHDKQWYTLVKLDEYGGVGHVVSDRELQELEDLILSGEDPSDDSSFNDGQTLSGDEWREDDSVDGEEPYSEDTGPLRLPVQVAAHQKPGGPCDHCGAQGTTRASLPRVFFTRASSRFPLRWRRRDGRRNRARARRPRRRAALKPPRSALSNRVITKTRADVLLPSLPPRQTPRSGAAGPRRNRCCATRAGRDTDARTTSDRPRRSEGSPRPHTGRRTRLPTSRRNGRRRSRRRAR